MEKSALYRSLVYCKDINQNLICPICTCPFFHPVTADCGHTFCEHCIQKSLEIKPNCPTCRKSISSDSLSLDVKIISNMVDELDVHCLNDGCTSTFQRQFLLSHLKECGYSEVACSIAGCELKLKRKDLESHLKDCPHRHIACDRCGLELKFIGIEDHLASSCSPQLHPCSFCSVEVLVPLLQSHQSLCDKRIVPCDMSEKGCEWSGCFSELSAHKTGCPYIALQTFIHQHDNQVEILNNQVHSLQAENQNLKLTIGTLEEQIQMIMERLDPLLQLTTNSPFSPIETNMSLVDTSNILLSEHDQIKSDIEMLSANLASLESKQNLALMTEHLKIQEDLQHLRNVHSKTREEVQSLRNLYSLLLMERKVKGSSRIASTSGVSKPQRSSESHQSGGHKQETKL